MVSTARPGWQVSNPGQALVGHARYDAVHDGGGGRGIGVASDRHGDAEHFTGPDEADENLFSCRRELIGSNAALQQQEETIGPAALNEDGGVLRETHRTRFAQNLVDLLG